MSNKDVFVMNREKSFKRYTIIDMTSMKCVSQLLLVN